MRDIKIIYNLNEKQSKKLEEEIKKIAILTPLTEDDIIDIVKNAGLKGWYTAEEMLVAVKKIVGMYDKEFREPKAKKENKEELKMLIDLSEEIKENLYIKANKTTQDIIVREVGALVSKLYTREEKEVAEIREIIDLYLNICNDNVLKDFNSTIEETIDIDVKRGGYILTNLEHLKQSGNQTAARILGEIEQELKEAITKLRN